MCVRVYVCVCVFLANATEEFFVRKSPLYEVVGQLGMWGMIINGIQAAGLEHNDMRTATWDGFNSEFLFVPCFHSISPRLSISLFRPSFPSLFHALFSICLIVFFFSGLIF